MRTAGLQRFSAVRLLETLGYSFSGSEWQQPTKCDANLAPEADVLHALLVDRASMLASGGEETPEDQQAAPSSLPGAC